MDKKRQRAVRSDRKHKYVLRLDMDTWDKVRALSFNTRQSYNVVLVALITAALASDEIINSLYLAYGRNARNLVMFWDHLEE